MIEDILSLKDYTYWGKGHSYEGNFQIHGEIRIAAQVQGVIKQLDPQATITIDPEAEVNGEIHGYDITIRGVFLGQIYSQGKVIIKSSGSVIGSIQCKNLEVMPGANLQLKADSNPEL